MIVFFGFAFVSKGKEREICNPIKMSLGLVYSLHFERFIKIMLWIFNRESVELHGIYSDMWPNDLLWWMKKENASNKPWKILQKPSRYVFSDKKDNNLFIFINVMTSKSRALFVHERFLGFKRKILSHLFNGCKH